MSIYIDADALVRWERGRFDLPFQIAATALVDGAELLTFNTEHFGRVPGLRLAKS